MVANESIEKTLYHATTKNNAEEIIKDKKIRIIKQYTNPIHNGKRQGYIKKDPGSLGYGFYLFSDESLANDFRIEKINSDSNILMLKIKMPNNTLLDLTDENTLKDYNLYKRKVSENQFIKQAKRAFENSISGQSAIEGATIDYYIGFLEDIYKVEKKQRKFNCVRGFTATQIELSKGSYVANGIEYCLKNRDVIEKVELLKEDNNDT